MVLTFLRSEGLSPANEIGCIVKVARNHFSEIVHFFFYTLNLPSD